MGGNALVPPAVSINTESKNHGLTLRKLNTMSSRNEHENPVKQMHFKADLQVVLKKTMNFIDPVIIPTQGLFVHVPQLFKAIPINPRCWFSHFTKLITNNKMKSSLSTSLGSYF